MFLQELSLHPHSLQNRNQHHCRHLTDPEGLYSEQHLKYFEEW